MDIADRASKSMKDLKRSVFDEEGPSPDLLIQLAPFLGEPLLSRAISIANAVSDPLQRALILLALARSANISAARKKSLVGATIAAAHEISSKSERIRVLEEILPLTSGQDRLSIKAELAGRENFQTDKDIKLKSFYPQEDPEKFKYKSKETAKSAKDELAESHKVGRKQLKKWDSIEKEKIKKGAVKGKKSKKPLTPSPEEDGGKETALAGGMAKIRGDERSDLAREVLMRLQTRTVNTGFAASSQADKSMDSKTPLQMSRQYYFWLDIGRPTLHSIETEPASIPDFVPSGARLIVAIFPFEDEIEIFPGSDVGELQLEEDGTARVLRQPDASIKALSDKDLLNRRLLFPVKAPDKKGTFRLRCNIYCQQILIQSRLVSVVVVGDGLDSQPRSGALQSRVDYALSHTLWADHLRDFVPHRLSILLNSNGDGTHTLSFLGAEGGEGGDLFKNSAVIPATELKLPIENARKALWKASWGKEVPWMENSGMAYRYKDRFDDKDLDLKRLEEDLIPLARRGYILYNAIIGKFTRSRSKTYELARMMLSPGMVQIAIKESPTQILPAALFYDYPLDTQAEGYKICEAFKGALQEGSPLESAPCFNGLCPHSKGDASGNPDGYICPSGFWGYRHVLGFPASVPDGMDAPSEIIMDGDSEVVVGAATNLEFVKEHMQALREIRPDLVWHYSEKRSEIFNNLKNPDSHLVYFYCHGGVTNNNVPYLQVGDGRDFIDGSNLLAYRIFWDGPQPLVFINGCHTTALDPEKVINLVADFLGAGSSGVIGTEITIFEPLACSFAEACLGYFLRGERGIGDAIRMARLKLLGEYNPLGLVYTPFVIPSLRIKDSSRVQ